MASSDKKTVLTALLDELDRAIPALRELAEVNDRLAFAKKAEAAAKEAADAAEVSCAQVLARCAAQTKAAEEARDTHIAEAEAEALRRSNEAREKHERWQTTAKATRAREDAEAEARAAELRAVRDEIESKRKELADIEARLTAAKQAFKSALAEVA